MGSNDKVVLVYSIGGIAQDSIFWSVSVLVIQICAFLGSRSGLWSEKKLGVSKSTRKD